MADGLFNVEILMRMSKNVRDKNEEWRREVWHEGQERYREAKQLQAMFEAEYASLDQELKRLEHYAPTPTRQDQQVPQLDRMPKAVTKGPATS
jgi:hypothetical protein